MCQHTEKFGVSSKLQELICLLSQDCVFEEAEQMLAEFLGISVCAKQIQRVSEHYGEKLEESEENYREEKQSVPLVSTENQESVYVTVDGSGGLYP